MHPGTGLDSLKVFAVFPAARKPVWSFVIVTQLPFR